MLYSLSKLYHAGNVCEAKNLSNRRRQVTLDAAHEEAKAIAGDLTSGALTLGSISSTLEFLTHCPYFSNGVCVDNECWIENRRRVERHGFDFWEALVMDGGGYGSGYDSFGSDVGDDAYGYYGEMV
jgi:hypothetical protein